MKKLSFSDITKTLAVCLVLCLLPFVNSCQKEKTDVTDLLSTVPSSTGGVIGFNLKAMLEKAGCSVNGSVIKPGKDLEQWIASQPQDKKNDIIPLMEGDTGIEPESAVIFNDAGRNFLTVALADPDKFIAYIEQKSRLSFTTENDVKVCGTVAVRGSQAWICLTQGRTIDPHAISAYASLNASQSFLENKFSKDIANMSDDIIGWGQLNSLVKDFLSFGQMSVFNMVTGMLFEDASALSFKLNFKKGELESSLCVLNDKGNPAKYLLPSDKIDDDVLEMLGTDCNALIAFSITPKFVEKISKLGSAFGGNLMGDLSEYLKNINGTVGVALAGSETDGKATLDAIVTTKGPVSLDLKSFLTGMIGNVKEEGNYLRITNGEVTGSLSLKECADELDGAYMGAVCSMDFVSDQAGKKIPSLKNVVVKIEPESNGIELEIELKTIDKKENILLTLIKENQVKI